MLNPTQKANLKAAILADPTLNEYANTLDGAYALCAERLNVLASPAFVVWEDALTPDKFRAAMIIGATQFDGLTQGKRDEMSFLREQTLDCRDPAVRAAIDDSAGSAATLKTALNNATKRNALLGEKLVLPAGTVGTTATPATTTYVGALSPNDVQEARNS